MDVFDLVAKITIDSSAFNSGLDKIKGAFGTIAGVGAKAIGAATTAVSAFATSAIKAGAGFDTSMSQVAATMGYTTDQINTAGSEANQTFEKLRDFAQKMGRETKFSASQSADALNYMALAGYDAETSIGMLPNVLNLAAAGSMDLASASDMVTDAASALGMTLEDGSVDVERVTSMIDGMAVTASKSNTSVAQLGSAILTIGGTAKQLRGGFVEMADGTKKAYDGTTELSAALGILADNGVKGSEGGTALRNVLNTFSGNKFAKTFGAMGAAVYDASGEMRSMKDILKDMNGVMEGMTTEEKTGLINSTFNARDLKNVNALLATTTDRWDQLTMSIEDSKGAAQEMANTQLDNLEGDITTFKSAWEGLQIAISDTAKGPLREFVRFGTQAVGDLTQAFEAGGFEGLMTQLGTSLTQGVSLIATYIPTFVKSGIQLLQALGQGILSNLDQWISICGEVFDYLITALVDASSDTSGIVEVLVKIGEALFGEGLPILLQATIDLFSNVLTSLAKALPELIPLVVGAIISTLVMLLTNADQFLAVAEAILVGIVQGLMNSIPILLGQIPALWDMIVTAVTVTIPEAFMSIGQAIIDAILAGLEQYFPGITEKFNEKFAETKEALAKIMQGAKDILDRVIAWFAPFVSAIGNYLSALWGLITAIVGKIKERITAFLEEHKIAINAALITIKAIINGVLGFIKNYIMTVVTYVKNIITTALNLIAGIMKTVTSALKGDWKGAWDNIKNTISTAVTDVTRIFNDLVEGITKIWNGIIETAKNWGRDMIDNIIGGIKEKFSGITEAIGGVAKIISDHVHFSEPEVGPLSNFHTYAPDMMKLFAQGIKDNENLVRNQLERSFDFSDVLASQNVSFAGNSGSRPVGNSIVMNIYPSAGMDEKALAKEISYRLSDQEERTKVIQRDTRTKATWRLANA